METRATPFARTCTPKNERVAKPNITTITPTARAAQTTHKIDLFANSIFVRPFLSSFVVLFLVGFEDLGDLRHQRIIRVWVIKKGTNRKKHFGNGKCRAPLILQDIKADSTSIVDVAVVNASCEGDLRWLKWIVRWV